MICRVRLSFWRMKTVLTPDFCSPADGEIWILTFYASLFQLFEHIHQGNNGIRQIISCRESLRFLIISRRLVMRRQYVMTTVVDLASILRSTLTVIITSLERTCALIFWRNHVLCSRPLMRETTTSSISCVRTQRNKGLKT